MQSLIRNMLFKYFLIFYMLFLMYLSVLAFMPVLEYFFGKEES